MVKVNLYPKEKYSKPQYNKRGNTERLPTKPDKPHCNAEIKTQNIYIYIVYTQEI